MRDGLLLMVDDERLPLKPGEVPQMRSIRFRTLGCYPLTGAVESEAATLPEIIQEMLLTKSSERQGRVVGRSPHGLDLGRQGLLVDRLVAVADAAGGRPGRWRGGPRHGSFAVRCPQ